MIKKILAAVLVLLPHTLYAENVGGRVVLSLGSQLISNRLFEERLWGVKTKRHNFDFVFTPHAVIDSFVTRSRASGQEPTRYTHVTYSLPGHIGYSFNQKRLRLGIGWVHLLKHDRFTTIEADKKITRTSLAHGSADAFSIGYVWPGSRQWTLALNGSLLQPRLSAGLASQWLLKNFSKGSLFYDIAVGGLYMAYFPNIRWGGFVEHGIRFANASVTAGIRHRFSSGQVYDGGGFPHITQNSLVAHGSYRWKHFELLAEATFSIEEKIFSGMAGIGYRF